MNTQQKKSSKFTIVVLMLMAVLHLPIVINAQSEIKGDATEESKQIIRELNKKIVDAFHTGDINKVVEFYADDATVIIPGGKKIQGKKAIHDYLSSQNNLKEYALNITDINGNGKVLYQVGTLSVTADTNGNNETRISNQVKIWKRGTDWDYKISVDSFN